MAPWCWCICVFDEFVLIVVCFRSSLSVSMVRERVQLWFWNECLTYSICIFMCVSVAPLSRCWICTATANVRIYISVVSLQSEMWRDAKTWVLWNNVKHCWTQKQPYIVTSIFWPTNKWLLQANSFKKLHRKSLALQLILINEMNPSLKFTYPKYGKVMDGWMDR